MKTARYGNRKIKRWIPSFIWLLFVFSLLHPLTTVKGDPLYVLEGEIYLDNVLVEDWEEDDTAIISVEIVVTNPRNGLTQFDMIIDPAGTEDSEYYINLDLLNPEDNDILSIDVYIHLFRIYFLEEEITKEEEWTTHEGICFQFREDTYINEIDVFLSGLTYYCNRGFQRHLAREDPNDHNSKAEFGNVWEGQFHGTTSTTPKVIHAYNMDFIKFQFSYGFHDENDKRDSTYQATIYRSCTNYWRFDMEVTARSDLINDKVGVPPQSYNDWTAYDADDYTIQVPEKGGPTGYHYDPSLYVCAYPPKEYPIDAESPLRQSIPGGAWDYILRVHTQQTATWTYYGSGQHVTIVWQGEHSDNNNDGQPEDNYCWVRIFWEEPQIQP